MYLSSFTLRSSWLGDWYRAEIVSSSVADDDSKCGVLFVDYGNHDTVDKNAVKSVHPQIRNIVPFVVKCSFE